MQSGSESFVFWSDGLALALLSSISNDKLLELAADQTKHDGDPHEVPLTDLVSWLQRQCRNHGPLQLAIMRLWRQLNPEVVSAAQLISIDGSIEHCEAMLRQFSAKDLLLELITDERDDGWEMAAWVVDNVKSESVRRELAELLEQWSISGSDTIEPDVATVRKVRVVIFGGHVRDGNKMTERLFDSSSFDVRWRPFEKGVGIPSVKVINEAMFNADAVLLVTTMVSHNIMQMVKRYARDNGIPFRAISKATDVHLTAALSELFPNIAPGEQPNSSR